MTDPDELPAPEPSTPPVSTSPPAPTADDALPSSFTETFTRSKQVFELSEDD